MSSLTDMVRLMIEDRERREREVVEERERRDREIAEERRRHKEESERHMTDMRAQMELLQRLVSERPTAAAPTRGSS